MGADELTDVELNRQVSPAGSEAELAPTIAPQAQAQAQPKAPALLSGKGEIQGSKQAEAERYEISYRIFGKAHVILLASITMVPLVVFLIDLIYSQPGWVAAGRLLGFLLPVLAVAIVPTVMLWRRAKIVLSQDGIGFSGHWYSLGRRRFRTWDDVHAIQLVYPGVAVPEDSPIVWRGEKFRFRSLGSVVSLMYSPWLMLDFSSGGTARILLNRLTKAQAQYLLKALETFNGPSKFASEVVNLERSLLLGTEDMPTFTKMWEDQLNAQYVSTNYVPLPTNYELQSGAYKVLMQLAAGGMSAVYLADDKDGKKVVIKEAVAPPGTDERQRQKSRELFEREARLLMKLSHPRIARVFDYFVERDRDYLVLEFVNGSTLKQLVKEEGKQKEARVLQWSKQIAETIEYLHGQAPPILHRDLTPDNLILTNKGQVKLVDFGAAREYVGSATGTFIGKQCYIPPEQLRGKAVPQSDLYALGATMNYLLTGKDPLALCQSHPREAEPSVSADTDALVARLTALETSQRPESAVALRALIDEILSGAKASTFQ